MEIGLQLILMVLKVNNYQIKHIKLLILKERLDQFKEIMWYKQIKLNK